MRRLIPIVVLFVAAAAVSTATAGTTRGDRAVAAGKVDLVVCKRVRSSGDCLVEDEYPRHDGAYLVPRGAPYWLWWRVAVPKGGQIIVFTSFQDERIGGRWTLHERRGVDRRPVANSGLNRYWARWAWTKDRVIQHVLLTENVRGQGERRIRKTVIVHVQ